MMLDLKLPRRGGLRTYSIIIGRSNEIIIMRITSLMQTNQYPLQYNMIEHIGPESCNIYSNTLAFAPDYEYARSENRCTSFNLPIIMQSCVSLIPQFCSSPSCDFNFCVHL